MNKKLKDTLILGSLFVASFCIITGCSLVGTDPKAPSAFEQNLFTTVTNYVDVVRSHTVTNFVEVPVYKTNEVGQIVTATNIVPQYEIVTVTNTIPQYSNTTKPEVKESIAGAGGFINTFFPGAGSIISTGLVALLGAWAQLRSSKRKSTAIALAQEIETVRQFIKTLPNGTNYDVAITKFLQDHQIEAGVIDQVLAVLGSHVNSDEAKGAVNFIDDAVKAASTPPKV